MGQKKSSSNALAVQLDAEGKIKYDAIAKYGHAKDKVSQMLVMLTSMNFHCLQNFDGMVPDLIKWFRKVPHHLCKNTGKPQKPVVRQF